MKHERSFDPCYGTAVEVADGVRRLTVQNPGPFTFHGTNSYILGTGDVAILDPGPEDPVHLDALLKATRGQKIAAILVSHTHLDHSPGARALQQTSGAPIVGCAPHFAARELRSKEVAPLDASADRTYRPDQLLEDGECFSLCGFTLEAIATPGHTANHLCLALKGTDLLFSADHVMAWSTSIVAPPDGSMADYMASLERLMARKEDRYFPGHGGPVEDAHSYMNDLRQHRLTRERSILKTLGSEPKRILEIVDEVYVGLDPSLKPAASLSVLAHLEDLTGRGTVIGHPNVSLNASFARPND